MSDVLDDPTLPDDIKAIVRKMDATGFPRPRIRSLDDLVDGECSVCKDSGAINLATGRCGACDADQAILSCPRAIHGTRSVPTTEE